MDSLARHTRLHLLNVAFLLFRLYSFFFFFFFNDTATTEIYTLSLHDALPISCLPWPRAPSSYGADRPGRYGSESSWTCSQRANMLWTCQTPYPSPLRSRLRY